MLRSPIAFERIENLDTVLAPVLFDRQLLPWKELAGFLAGKCFVRYRERAGLRRSPLPDFYI